MPVVAIFGPTGVGKTGVAIALGGAAAGAGRGPGGDHLRRAAGLRGARDPDRGRDRRGAGAARAPAGRVRAGHRATSRSATTCRSPTRRSTRRWRRGGGRSWSAAPGSTCGPALAELSLVKGAAGIGGLRALVAARRGTRRRSSGSTWTGRSSTSGSTRGPRRSSPPGRAEEARRAEALGPVAHRPQGARLRRAARRRRRGDEEALAQLRPPPAHLDAQDPEPARRSTATGLAATPRSPREIVAGSAN